uniref:Uncharacterized protein n=1 Tax=Picea glauca TaxID=3330 RepID=A0A101M493_PICGL|nr:hypothetical protein ABT39_MTgene630 [Picea glauca]
MRNNSINGQRTFGCSFFSSFNEARCGPSVAPCLNISFHVHTQTSWCEGMISRTELRQE